MDALSKSFGATQALDQVGFFLEKGEVHALLGENGAGKSTMVKILSGAVKPDSGSMTIEGEAYSPTGPLDGRRRGISMIYQELNLAPHLTVEENIMLGQEIRSRGFLSLKSMKARVREALEIVHHPEISPDIPVRKLSVGAKQLVEIARALMNRAKILVMDEPTSSLSHEDGLRLFEIVRRLKTQGVSVIYISHFLEEVQKVADSFTVLRDGRNVGTGRMGETSLEELIQLMVGQKFTELFPRVEHVPGEVLLSLRNVLGRHMQAEASLDLRRGEILGIAGLIGAGRTEMLRSVFGLDSLEKGCVVISGTETSRPVPWWMIAHGAGMMSEDRQGEGLALARSIADNMTLSDFKPFLRHGILRTNSQRKAAWDLVEKMKIKARTPTQKVFSLSGGNQQKVALARLLHQKADAFLLDEPTRGIDVISKAQIYESIGELARQGKSILFVSSYLPELLGVSDRIAVFHRGQIVAVKDASEWDAQSLMSAATVGRTLDA